MTSPARRVWTQADQDAEAARLWEGTRFAPAKFDAERMQAEAYDRRVAYTRKIESGLRSNLLVTLQLIIERDPAIPSGKIVSGVVCADCTDSPSGNCGSCYLY